MVNNSEHTFAVLAYKESPYIEDCIISLKKQSMKSNIIIATSTPSAFLELLSKKHVIPLMVNTGHKTIASDWSFAYNSCSTPYVTLAHQDDIYDPDYTRAALLLAKKRRYNPLIVFTDYHELLPDARVRKTDINILIKRMLLLLFVFKKHVRSRFCKKLIIRFGNPICCPSVMYHKAKIGPFQFSNEYVFNLDWDAWIRLSAQPGSFVYLNQDMVAHRIHKDSQTSLVIRNNVRKDEEQKLFGRLWPHYIAQILTGIYSAAAKSNIEERYR
jgi:hypothetical protein